MPPTNKADAPCLNDATVAPLVSILIPVHNCVEYTRACLESVFTHADPSVPFEIIIIDDDSSDGTLEYLQSLPNLVRLIHNQSRKCFGVNMNAGAAMARGRYLCLLNNDTLVTAGWLTRMVEVVQGDPAIGVAGNRHLFPQTGKLNHAGMVFDSNYLPVHLYPGLDADFPVARLNREFQILTAACWLVPKAVFQEAGGFDSKFTNGFEDVDFCLRIRDLGFKVTYVGNSVIYHYGQTSPGRKDNDQKNKDYFIKKWRGRIVSDLEEYLIRDGMAGPRPRPHDLPASPIIPHSSADLHFSIPMESANAFTWVTTRLAVACEELGLQISLKKGPIDRSVDSKDAARLKKMMQRPASRHAHIRWNHYWPSYLNAETSGEINADLFVTNYEYGPRSIHELDKWMRHVVTSPNRKLPASLFSQQRLLELGVDEDISRIVPYGYSPEIAWVDDADPRFKNQGFVFLAITNSHDLYRYGTDVLLDAYAKAFKPTDDVVLVLQDYGKGADRTLLQKWIEQKGSMPRVVHLTKFLTKEDLIRLYRAADAFVAPFRGEGFGMKILDAAALGLPILAPAHGGPRDFLVPGSFTDLSYKVVPVGECCDRQNSILPQFARWIDVDANDLAAKMTDVRQEPAGARARAQICKEKALKDFSWRRCAETLVEALQDFARQRETVIASRRPAPASKKISVIMPTRNRPRILERCLHAYRYQTLPLDQWELIIADDGSDTSVQEITAPYSHILPIKLLELPKQGGPGLARNKALPKAEGEFILFTGDDIIPEPGFLESHLAAHRANPVAEGAVLGHTSWHPELPVTPLMDYITGEGGQQFHYDILTPYKAVPCNYFYTSNVSIARNFLLQQEHLFNKHFTSAALEDTELGLRLGLQGLKMIYDPRARAGHLHPMDDQSIYRRNYMVGRMLAVYGSLHPEALQEEHSIFLHWLDTIQHVLMHDRGFASLAGELSSFGEAMNRSLNELSTLVPKLASLFTSGVSENPLARALFTGEGGRWRKLIPVIYEYRLELELRCGMADEWMGVEAGRSNPARDFFVCYLCQSFWDKFGLDSRNAAQQDRMLGAQTLLKIARRLRHHPWINPLWERALRVPGGRLLKSVARTVLSKLP